MYLKDSWIIISAAHMPNRPLVPTKMTGRAEVHQLLTIIAQSATEALNEYEKHGSMIPSIYETSELSWDGLEASVNLKKSIRALEGACDQLCATLAPPLHTIVNVSLSD